MYLKGLVGWVARVRVFASRRIEQAMEYRLKPSGLSIAQFRVMKRLALESGIAMGDLAARIFVDSPTLTRIIDKMVASAHVYRGSDPADRRRVLIFISENGRTTYEQFQWIECAAEKELVDRLGEQGQRHMKNTLKSLLEESSGAAEPSSQMKTSERLSAKTKDAEENVRKYS